MVDIALYSASVNDRDTICCFLEYQEIGLDPKKKTKPVVDCLLLGSYAQSASLNALSDKSLLEYVIPQCWVPFKYIRILLTAMKWATIGFCINWQDLMHKEGNIRPCKSQIL